MGEVCKWRMVTVDHMPTEKNQADLFTKILKRQVFSSSTARPS